MLDLLRRKAQSPYVQVTVLIIIIVFIFLGAGSKNRGASNAVATVNGEPITLQEFEQAYQRTMDNLRNQFGGNLPKGFAESLNLKKQVVQELIQRTLMLQGGRDMGIHVSDHEIQDDIKNMTVFQDNGVFDVTRYREVLKGSRLTPTKFEAGLKTDLLMSKIGTDLAGFARITPQELEERFQYYNSEMRIDYGLFKPDEYTAKVKVTDQQLADYFAKNKENYKSAPQIKIRYLSFLVKDEMAKITIPDQEIEEYYNSHQDEFGQPEKRRISHILLTTTPENKEKQRTEMEKILAKVKAGEDFAALARQYSEDSSAAKGGDLGFFTSGQLAPPLAEAAFSLKKDEISSIIDTPIGYDLLKVTDIQPAQITPLAQVKATIEQKLKKQAAQNSAFEKANAAYEKIIFAGSLTKYAENFKVSLSTTDFFTQSAPPPALAGLTTVIDTAFTLKKGELSSIIESPEGYTILAVEDRREPTIPALAEIKPKVEKDYIAGQAKILAQKDAEETLAAFKKEKELDFTKTLTEKGVSIHESGYFSRTSRPGKELPQEVMQAAFTLSAASPYPEKVVAADNAFYIFRFKDKKEATDEKGQARKAFEARLAMEKQKEVLDGWINYLMKKGQVTINEKYLK